MAAMILLQGQGNIRFENYRIEDGLPHSIINCVYQDHTGWIWIGTTSGLARFDGYSFSTYMLENKASEEALSMVNCLWEDADFNLWIGTEYSGLVRYNPGLEEFTYFSHSDSSQNCISSNLVHSIKTDSSGVMWLATENGLNRFDPETETFQWIRRKPHRPSSISSDSVLSLLIDDKHGLWVGTGNGLDYYDLETNQITNIKNGISVESLYQDKKGNILAGTYHHGLYIIDPREGDGRNIIPDQDYLRSFTIRAIYEDQNGALWLGTRGGIYILDGDYRVNAHLVHQVQDQSSLGHNSVNHIFEDQIGNLWIGSRNGVSFANLEKTAFLFHGAGFADNRYLNDPEVYCVAEGNNGNIWLGTESGGVNILNRETGTFAYLVHDENNENSISSNCIKAIIQDRNGNFWIGTFLGGLDHYDVKQRRFIHYTHDPQNDNSLSDNTIWALHEDRQGRIWIGTDKGLDRFDATEERFHHYGKMMQNRAVQAIFEDSKGNLYMGSSSRGLTVMTPEAEMLHFELPARVIFEDSGGRIWIGSDRNTGLKQFDIQQGIINTYTTEDGLASNQVFGILEDEDSQLWISTGQGLSVFNVDKEEFKTYNTADGIQGKRFYYGSYCRSSSGELLFGGQNGLTRFYPDRLKENNNIPPVVITGFKIFNKPVPVGREFEGEILLDRTISETKELVLRYDHSVLSFDYVALNYVNSSENKYAHMLEGFESEWNYVKSNRSASYTNLNPGRYTFRVKAGNNDDTWNTTGVSLDIIITPPFWKTNIFKILILLMIIFIVFLIVLFFLKREKLKNQLVLERVKSKELHKMDMMKFQFFTNISHEIRTPISLILSPLTRIINSDLSKQQIKRDLDVVYRNATRLGKLIDQLLDYRKIEAGKLKLELSKGDIVSFLKKVMYLFKELSADKRVNLEFYSVLDQIQMYFDPDKIEKVMFNLLSNAFKHTPEGGNIRVAVSLTYQMDQDHSENGNVSTGEYVQIVVKDTGQGIPENKREKIFERFYQEKSSGDQVNTGSGIGLSLSRELVKIHNGSISLRSQEGMGTEFKILLPVIKEDPDRKAKLDIHEFNEFADELSEAAEGPVSDSLHVDNGKPILLVLEDNRELLEFIISIFEEDYQVIFAEDGTEGLRLANETIPDIVISDILMPEMDGKKVCKALKEDFKTSHIPVILLTALSSRQHEKEGILVGADEYIVKPFEPSLLKIRVDQLLSTRRLLREKYNRENMLLPAEKRAISPDDKFLQKLVDIIENNISDPSFGTVKISREIGVSRTQLYRKMAALTEMTVKEFIRSVRLKRACQLLLQKEMNISEIAYEVGFQQVAYFRKCFKELYKMTPSEYIKKNSTPISNWKETGWRNGVRE
jgi:signal transduction histidine kinase/ligand-binding sensor domain-containing protein/CheY-like chemotaxis protein